MESSRSLKELMSSLHREGITLFDYNGTKIPCIFVKQGIFDEIAKACYGKPVRVESNLNILHNDQREVFVEIILEFAETGKEQKFLLYANENLGFFERLAESGIIALAPEGAGQAGLNIFMLQLPKRDALERSLETIKSYMR